MSVPKAAAGFSPMGEISERQARFEARAFQEGTVLRAKDGTRYVMGHVTALSCTLRRVVPKVRGKQARKDERRRRRELRKVPFASDVRDVGGMVIDGP